MYINWQDLIFLLTSSLSFGILWRVATGLDDPRFGKLFWDSFFRLRLLANRMWVFSAETALSQEVEFIGEYPFDFSRFFSWGAKAFLVMVYLLVLVGWMVSG